MELQEVNSTQGAQAFRRLRWAVLCLGASATATQTLLLREFLALFAGNELVIGCVLASWMLLTGAGAYAAPSVRSHWHAPGLILIVLLILVAVLPPLTVTALPVARDFLTPPGVMPGFVESLLISLVLLAPFCAASGALFTLLAGAISRSAGESRVALAYALEAAGSLAGGVLFTLLLPLVLSTMQALLLLALPALSAAFLILRRRGSPLRKVLAVLMPLIAVAAVALAVLLPAAGMPGGGATHGQNLLAGRDTPYGRILVTGQGQQVNFFENGTLLFSTEDPVLNEEAIHYAMLQHPKPERVLLLSGGITGMTAEILKYPVRAVDYVEMNGWLLQTGERFGFRSPDPRVRTIVDDPRRFVAHASGPYDVALINTADPGTAQANRLYTHEFFSALRRILAPGAVVSLGLPSSGEYSGPEAQAVGSVIFRTLAASFTHVLIVPGLKEYYLASDSTLSLAVGTIAEARGIPTVYVNRAYIDEPSLRERSHELTAQRDVAAPLNTDFRPVAYYRQMLFWLSMFGGNPWVLFAAFLVVPALILPRLRIVTAGMLVGGFAASALEVVLLLAFQIVYASLFYATGAIISLFMAGLGLGAWTGARAPATVRIRSYGAVQLCTAIAAVVLPFLLELLKSWQPGGPVVYLCFGTLAAGIALLTGIQFAWASRLQGPGTDPGEASTGNAASLYAADLIGSSVGALAVSAFLIPLLGLRSVCFIVGLCCLVSGMAAVRERIGDDGAQRGEDR